MKFKKTLFKCHKSLAIILTALPLDVATLRDSLGPRVREVVVLHTLPVL